MPTVLRLNGCRFYFYSHEPNEPPHIHVDRGDASIKVWLETLDVARSVGFRPHDIGGIIAMVRDHQTLLLDKWHEYFDENR